MKADMCSARARVRCGPIANMESAARSTYGFLGMPPSANVRAVSGPSYGGRSMSDNPDHTRRWLINASGAAFLSNVLTGGPSSAQVAGTSTTKSQDPNEASADAPISPVTTALCDYVASALDRDMPPEVVAKAKLHTLDTIAAMVSGLRLKPREVRYAFSFAAQQGSGIPYWERDREHVEKASDFGGMGARNGVTAATMIASGLTGVDDFLSGTKNLFTAIGGETPAPGALAAELGKRFEIMNTSIKKWTVGSPLQSVLDGVAVLLEDPAVRAGKVKRIVVDMPADRLH